MKTVKCSSCSSGAPGIWQRRRRRRNHSTPTFPLAVRRTIYRLILYGIRICVRAVRSRLCLPKVLKHNKNTGSTLRRTTLCRTHIQNMLNVCARDATDLCVYDALHYLSTYKRLDHELVQHVLFAGNEKHKQAYIYLGCHIALML